MHKEVALIACDDQTGLIHRITGVLLSHKLNITETQEFVDHTIQRFFMRIQFEGELEQKDIQKELRQILPESAFCQVRGFESRKVVVFVSKEPHCLGDLLLRYSTGELEAEILAVVSQHETCREITQRFGLP